MSAYFSKYRVFRDEIEIEILIFLQYEVKSKPKFRLILMLQILKVGVYHTHYQNFVVQS